MFKYLTVSIFKNQQKLLRLLYIKKNEEKSITSLYSFQYILRPFAFESSLIVTRWHYDSDRQWRILLHYLLTLKKHFPPSLDVCHTTIMQHYADGCQIAVEFAPQCRVYSLQPAQSLLSLAAIVVWEMASSKELTKQISHTSWLD